MREMVGGCCVCSDDRGWPENPLVYCDGQSCTVAVHQGKLKYKDSIFNNNNPQNMLFNKKFSYVIILQISAEKLKKSI